MNLKIIQLQIIINVVKYFRNLDFIIYILYPTVNILDSSREFAMLYIEMTFQIIKNPRISRNNSPRNLYMILTSVKCHYTPRIFFYLFLFIIFSRSSLNIQGRNDIKNSKLLCSQQRKKDATSPSFQYIIQSTPLSTLFGRQDEIERNELG